MADRVVAEIKDAAAARWPNYDSVAEAGAPRTSSRPPWTKFGKIDGVVSNAGICGTGAFHPMLPRNWDRCSRSTLYGGYNVIPGPPGRTS